MDAVGLPGDASQPPPPLPIARKTRLFAEQVEREREQAPEMHRVFQRDLCKLRLDTAKAYVKVRAPIRVRDSSMRGVANAHALLLNKPPMEPRLLGVAE